MRNRGGGAAESERTLGVEKQRPERERERERETGAQQQGERRERQREVWGVVGRAGAPLSALWRLSKEPSGT